MKSLPYIVSVLTVSLTFGTIAFAATPAFTTTQGGTGTSTPSGILFGDNGTTPRLSTVKIGSGLSFSGGTLSATGGGTGTISTSTVAVIGNLLYFSGVSTVANVGTTTHSFSGPFTVSGTIGALVGGSNSTITWNGLATTSQPSSSNLLVSNGGAGVFGVGTSTLTGTGVISVSNSPVIIGTSGAVISCATCLTASGAVTSFAQTYGTAQVGAITVATSSDTNIGLSITNSSGAFTFTPTWTGTLADGRIASASTWNAKQASLGTPTAGYIAAYLNGSWTGVATTTFSSPLLYSAGNVTCQVATDSVPGCLSAADHAAFNNKGSGTVTSVTLATPNSSLSLGGTNPVTTSGTINADINIAHTNWFTALQNFTNASTSQITATSSIWFTGVTASSLLALDANNKVIASSTIGANLLTGTLGTVNTSAPLGGGGALSAGGTLTLTCATCATFAYPFTTATTYSTTTHATSTSLWLNGGSFFASSTVASQLPYASTTAITATSAFLTKIGNLTTNGFLKTGSSDGTLSVDTNTYLTGNQSITLSGAVTGSGTTAITTAFGTLAQGILGNPASAATIPTAQATSTLYGDTATFLTTGKVGISSTTPFGLFSINPNGITGPAFLVGSSTATNFVITATGLVGIGSTTPIATLSIGNGTASSSASVAEYEYGKAGNNGTSTSATLSPRTSNHMHWPLGASATTLTLCNFQQGDTLTVRVTNPNQTAGALTWAVCSGEQLYWPAKTTPTQTTTANDYDIWSFIASGNVGSTSPGAIIISGSQGANY